MPHFRHESFSYYQVDRPIISGADVLLREVEEMSKSLGMITTASITEVSMFKDANDGSVELIEPKRLVRPIEEPAVDVFRATDLRMVLFRRVVRSDLVQSHQLKLIESKFDQNEKLISELEIDQDQADCLPVECDRVKIIEDKAYGRTMALVPTADASKTRIVQRQAASCRRELGGIVNLGRDTIFEAGVIPLATVPDMIDDISTNRFVDRINGDLLPRKVTLGKVAAYMSVMLSNTLIND